MDTIAKMTRRQFTRNATMVAVGTGASVAGAAEQESAGMNISVIGASSCIPDVGREMACMLIDGKHLVDTGWCAALKMREYGFDPLALQSIILTHCHHDHYIGLPQLLFYIGLRKRKGPPLKIIGPDKHLAQVVNAAVEFLQTPRFPEIAVDYKLVPLKGGDSVELPDLRLETMAANHVSGKGKVEQALVYKLAKQNGARAVLTGDTSYHPPIAEFAKRVPLLVHDGAHTAPKDAAEIAKRAGVGRLVLIHYRQSAAARALAEAKAVFPNSELAREGSILKVPAT